MSKYSKEKQDGIKSKIKEIAARDGKIPSCRKVSDKLYIDRNFAAKLLREIEKERLRNTDKNILYQELGKLETVFDYLIENSWNIIYNDKTSAYEKISASRLIAEAYEKIIRLKLYCGVLK
jgi:DNA-directed RNA polymerase specialized sigma subunit